MLASGVDSYGATSFAPVIPPPQPAQNVTLKNAPPQADAFTGAATMMAASQPVPPTMVSGSAGQSPHYVVTPGPVSPMSPQQPPAYLATMPSAVPSPPPGSAMPYGPPPQYGPAYPMMMPQSMQPMQAMQQQGTPGLAIASLICGLLGWIPFWIGFILCLLAIIFGGVVLAQTRPGQQGRGLAITGLVFGLVLVLPAACGL